MKLLERKCPGCDEGVINMSSLVIGGTAFPAECAHCGRHYTLAGLANVVVFFSIVLAGMLGLYIGVIVSMPIMTALIAVILVTMVLMRTTARTGDLKEIPTVNLPQSKFLFRVLMTIAVVGLIVLAFLLFRR